MWMPKGEDDDIYFGCGDFWDTGSCVVGNELFLGGAEAGGEGLGRDCHRRGGGLAAC